jgi:myo-inositol 2-dehydrogenase/D-chiro-inositol 1-dehydrogenase
VTGRLRVGVVGAGIMGADHARILAGQISGAVLTAVADVDRERAQAVVAEIPGAAVAEDALALVRDDGVDAVVIASSDATHAELVLAAIRAGKAVMCEKPLAPTLAEATGVLRALNHDGTADRLSLGFMRRFDPGYIQLKAALGAGAVGAALVVHCISRGVSAGPGTTSAYSVIGAAVHEFDAVPWLLGSAVVEVCWHAPRCSSHVEGLQDPQLTLLRTADGALTTLEVFLNARYGYDVRCEVVGETGALSLPEPVRLVTDSAQTRSSRYAEDWRPRFADAYRLELQAWVDSVITGSPTPLATAHDGLVASAVSDAVLRSMAADGRWTKVDVPSTDPEARA